MNDAGAVQRRRGPRKLDRDVTSLLEAKRGAARQPALQKFALIERHDGVEASLPPRRQLDDVAEPGARHARANPRLTHEGRAVGIDAADLRLWKFQRHFAALNLVLSPEQTG